MKYPDQAHLWMAMGNLHTPSEADGNQEVFEFTLSSFSIKKKPEF